MSTGFDYNRMALILAVLEKRAGYYFSSVDTYINVVGGIKLEEPAADLPVAISLVSSLKDEVINGDVTAFGEIGLAGEIRAVSNAELRIKEASKLGFKKCIIPHPNLNSISNKKDYNIKIVGVRTVRQAVEEALN